MYSACKIHSVDSCFEINFNFFDNTKQESNSDFIPQTHLENSIHKIQPNKSRIAIHDARVKEYQKDTYELLVMHV